MPRLLSYIVSNIPTSITFAAFSLHDVDFQTKTDIHQFMVFLYDFFNGSQSGGEIAFMA